MYRQDIWRFRNSNEYEIKYKGRYGAKGEKRSPRRKATREQIKKQNQLKREKDVRRIIKANFNLNDLWVTLKYGEGERPHASEVADDLRRFKNNMRLSYKNRGQMFKFIQRVEIGKHGGIHVHILVNRIRGEPATDELIMKFWNPKRPSGGMNLTPLYQKGDYKNLANYIVKEPDEEQYEQLSLFPVEERKQLIRYSTSRNLIRPQPETKEYTRRTVRKIIENGIEPAPGFYIDEESVDIGINPYTGMSYIHYTELRIKPVFPEPIPTKMWKKRRNKP